MIEDSSYILRAIACEYETSCMTLGELQQILINCGFTVEQCRKIIRHAINEKEIGRVQFKKIKKNMPPRETILFLKKKQKKK